MIALSTTRFLTPLRRGLRRRVLGLALLHLYRRRTLRIRPDERLLFLCEGNICRSPLAAAAARQRLGGLVDVSSAGLGAHPGLPAPEIAVAIARGMGVDLSGHRSVRVGDELIRSADHVIVMDRLNLLRAWRRFPIGRDKLVLLDAPNEIPDPHRKPEETFRRSYEQIRRAIERIPVPARERE